MRNIVLIFVILGWISTASAGITITGNHYSDGILLSDGYIQYTIGLRADNEADRVAAWSGVISGNLRQRMRWEEDAEVYSPTIFKPLGTATWIAQDSHFMIYAIDALTLTGSSKPFELNDGIVPEVPASYWGKGNLGGTFGLGKNLITMDFVLAQIVVPSGESFLISGEIATTNGVKIPIESYVPTENSGNTGGTDNTGGSNNTGGTDNTGGKDTTDGDDNTGGTDDDTDDTIDDVLPGARCTGIGMIIALSIFFGFAFVSESKRS